MKKNKFVKDKLQQRTENKKKKNLNVEQKNEQKKMHPVFLVLSSYLSLGESIQEDDFLANAEKERKQKERENDKKWRELDKTSTQKLNEKIKEHNAKVEESGGSGTKVNIPTQTLGSGVKEIPCICKLKLLTVVN